MAAEPDYEDTELQYYVRILDSCKGDAKARIGWMMLNAIGQTQTHKRRTVSDSLGKWSQNTRFWKVVRAVTLDDD